MKLNDAQRTFLLSGLRRARISARSVGGGRSASYLEGYDIRRTLIQVFGFGNFDIETTHVECVVDRPAQWEDSRGNKKEGFDVAYLATVKLTIHDTRVKFDQDTEQYVYHRPTVYTAGAVGSSTHQPDLTTAHDHALKSAETDALKRAAINLGTQFGLSLYEDGSPNDIVKLTLDVDPLPDRGVEVGAVSAEGQAEHTEAEASQERPNVGTGEVEDTRADQVVAQLLEIVNSADTVPNKLSDIGKVKSSTPDDVMNQVYGAQDKTVRAIIDEAAKRVVGKKQAS